jgi:hypothetical protein
MATGLRNPDEPSSRAELPVNGDQLQQTWFWAPKLGDTGYGARDVDDLVSRVAARLDAGRPAGAAGSGGDAQAAVLRWVVR